MELPDLVNRFGQLQTQITSDTNSTFSETSSTVSSSRTGKKKRHRKSKTSRSKQSTANPSGTSVPSILVKEGASASDSGVVSTLYPELSSIYLHPRGFENRRNCCYLNVTLQTLLHIPSFVDAFRALQNQGLFLPPSSSPNELTFKADSLCRIMLDLIHLYASNQRDAHPGSSKDAPTDQRTVDTKKCRNVVPSSELKQAISSFNIGPPILPDERFARILNLTGGMQEDGAECLNRVLSKFHEEIGELISNKPSNSANDQSCCASEDSDDWIVTDRSGKHRPQARQIQLQGGHSPIADLFSGVLVTRSAMKRAQPPVKGLSVDEMTRHVKFFSTKEPFFVLPLEIDDQRVTSVETALIRLAESERVTDYEDKAVGITSQLNRRLAIDRLPPYLILQLKRFTCVPHDISQSNGDFGQSWTVEKSLKLITAQSEITIPRKLLSDEVNFTLNQRRYRLHAVIFHVGQSVTSGHYTVAIRWNDRGTPQSSTNALPNFLYLDDTRACLLRGVDAVNSLLSSHRPLNATSLSFGNLPYDSATIPSGISQHPRTPYLFVYEAHTPFMNQHPE